MGFCFYWGPYNPLVILRPRIAKVIHRSPKTAPEPSTVQVWTHSLAPRTLTAPSATHRSVLTGFWGLRWVERLTGAGCRSTSPSRWRVRRRRLSRPSRRFSELCRCCGTSLLLSPTRQRPHSFEWSQPVGRLTTTGQVAR